MGRPKLSTVDVATEERLMAAAEREFGRNGFAAARLEDIAAGAGITRSSLLYHYPSKDALYAAAVHAAFARLALALGEAMGHGQSFEERLDALVERFLEFIAEHPAMPPLLLRELVDGRGPGHELLLAEVKPVLDQVEAFVKQHGRGKVRARLPVRAAVMQVASGALMRASAGDLAEPLWGPERTRALARLLVLEDPR
jgi:AcrR family transcriptional regulator